MVSVTDKGYRLLSMSLKAHQWLKVRDTSLGLCIDLAASEIHIILSNCDFFSAYLNIQPCPFRSPQCLFYKLYISISRCHCFKATFIVKVNLESGFCPFQKSISQFNFNRRMFQHRTKILGQKSN